ncbi:MAG TPA: exodeoxyribonuclease VII large subunit [Gaiellales bacterium]|nr:exodeoxyribonuclease VII large subunit [Gaiellales bacterium]
MSAPQQEQDTVRGRVLSVADANRAVAGWIGRLGTVWVAGELSELRRSDGWGIVFMTLKDPEAGAVLQATMPRARFDALEVAPTVGSSVQALGRFDLWQKRGELRFSVLRLEPVGIGLLLQAIEELRRRLAAEGLFTPERKRPLPFLPRTVGLICGADAAARRDVVETALARHPPTTFRVVEATVQGRAATASVAAAIAQLDADPLVDVIVVARGGGSVEDLLPFSDESLCRAIAACETPVVSAIGHEQDTPLCDLVADVRAGTPSLAGKLVVPDHRATARELDALLSRATTGLRAGAERSRRLLELLESRPALADPRGWITIRREPLERLRSELRRLPALRVERETSALAGLHDRLRLLGPAATLERGYAIVQAGDGAIVRTASAVSNGQRIGVRLAAGRLAATVDEVRPA